MDVYKINSAKELLRGNPYVGRGIVIGMSADGKKACFAYFIMGRSENSRNRVFVKTDDGVIIYPFDASKVKDPRLIIYSPVKRTRGKIIVTNGDQTDTVFDYLNNGKTFEEALDTRSYEPDEPNFTPRISGILDINGSFTYKLNILKASMPTGGECFRGTFSYGAVKGLGHFIHTYVTDGNPIPSFVGEPERIAVPDSPDEFCGGIWDNLDENNRVSLYAEYVDIESGETENRIINKNK